MSLESVLWKATCDICGTEKEIKTPKLPKGWKIESNTRSAGFFDGYAMTPTTVSEKHYCSNCWAIKDTLE